MKYKRNKINIMSSILSVALVSFFATSCGSNNDTRVEDTQEEIVNETETEPTETTELPTEYKYALPITLGEPIVTYTKEITVNNIEFTKKLKPKKKGFDYYTGTSGYSGIKVEPEKVFVNANVDVKNLEKQNILADDVMTVFVDYDDGYIYDSIPFVEYPYPGHLTKSYSSVEIVPLATERIQYAAECPEEVSTSNNTVLVLFEIEGRTYYYYLVE